MSAIPTKTRKTKAQLLELLASVMWVQPIHNGNPSCSCCGNMQHWGHVDGCELAEVLHDTTEPKES